MMFKVDLPGIHSSFGKIGHFPKIMSTLLDEQKYSLIIVTDARTAVENNYLLQISLVQNTKLVLLRHTNLFRKQIGTQLDILKAFWVSSKKNIFLIIDWQKPVICTIDVCKNAKKSHFWCCWITTIQNNLVFTFREYKNELHGIIHFLVETLKL